MIYLPFFLCFFIILVVVLYIRSQRSNAIVQRKLSELKTSLSGKYFLCDQADELGDDFIQLYGVSVGTGLKPGMKLIDLNNKTQVIKEVYAADEEPEKPDDFVPEGVEGTPLVFEDPGWNQKHFEQLLKKELVIPFKLLD